MILCPFLTWLHEGRRNFFVDVSDLFIEVREIGVVYLIRLDTLFLLAEEGFIGKRFHMIWMGWCWVARGLGNIHGKGEGVKELIHVKKLAGNSRIQNLNIFLVHIMWMAIH